jgi:hypothetical protein
MQRLDGGRSHPDDRPDFILNILIQSQSWERRFAATRADAGKIAELGEH